jgi:microcompartment protein CcmL/EutN
VVADVQTAVELGVGTLERPEQLVRSVVIPRLHPSMWENVADASRFSARVLERL